MKNLILIIVLLINTFNICYNQEDEWVEMISFSNRDEIISDYAIDESGNIYIIGIFQSDTIYFNNNKYLTKTHEMSRHNNFFAKYNSDGKCLWADKITGGNNNTYFGKINFDNNGNIYLLGEMSSNPFDTIRFNNGISIYTSRYSDEFSIIAKFNSDGICQWAEGINGGIRGIVIDKFNDLIVAGSFMSLLEFNNGFSLKNKSRPTSMGRDGFLAKYDDKGKCKGAEQISGWGNESISSPRLLANDYILIGTYSNDTDTIHFNNDIQLIFPKKMYERKSIAIYNLNGICESANIDTSKTSSNRVFDSKGNYYICDSFEGDSIKLDDRITLYNGSVNKKYGSDIYISKYDSDNIILWAHTITGKGNDKIEIFNVDDKDNLIITGQFNSDEIIFNNGFQLQRIKINKDNVNYFSATYEENGNCRDAVLTGRNFNRFLTNKSGTSYIIDYFLGDTLVINNRIYINRKTHNNDTIRANGIYIVKVKNTPSSVSMNTEHENIKLFPNPAGDYITIQFQTSEVFETSEVSKVQIFNTLGIDVSPAGGGVSGVDGGGFRMDISHIPAGVYFIRIGNKVEKFVKM